MSVAGSGRTETGTPLRKATRVYDPTANKGTTMQRARESIVNLDKGNGGAAAVGARTRQRPHGHQPASRSDQLAAMGGRVTGGGARGTPENRYRPDATVAMRTASFFVPGALHSSGRYTRALVRIALRRCGRHAAAGRRVKGLVTLGTFRFCARCGGDGGGGTVS